MKTQTNTYACQLCPDDESGFSLHATDEPVNLEHMYEHLRDMHDVAVEDAKQSRGRPLLFTDGTNGYAAQDRLYSLPDGRAVIAHHWEQRNVSLTKRKRA